MELEDDGGDQSVLDLGLKSLVLLTFFFAAGILISATSFVPVSALPRGYEG